MKERSYRERMKQDEVVNLLLSHARLIQARLDTYSRKLVEISILFAFSFACVTKVQVEDGEKCGI